MSLLIPTRKWKPSQGNRWAKVCVSQQGRLAPPGSSKAAPSLHLLPAPSFSPRMIHPAHSRRCCPCTAMLCCSTALSRDLSGTWGFFALAMRCGQEWQSSTAFLLHLQRGGGEKWKCCAKTITEWFGRGFSRSSSPTQLSDACAEDRLQSHLITGLPGFKSCFWGLVLFCFFLGSSSRPPNN